MKTSAWLIEIKYKNAAGFVVLKKEYHASQSIAHSRLDAIVSKLRVVSASIKREFSEIGVSK